MTSVFDLRPLLIVITGISVNLLLLLVLTHISFSRARIHTRKFFDLSYHNPVSGNYGIGWDDAFLVSYWIVFLTGLRVAIMDYILAPLAQMHGLRGKGKIRFAEQAWLIIYAGTSSAVGTVSSTSSSSPLQIDDMGQH